MKLLDRRQFVQLAGVASIATGLRQATAEPFVPVPDADAFSNPLGLVLWIRDTPSIDRAIQSARDMGLSTCQLGFSRLTPDVAGPVKDALAKYGVTATAFSEHGPGVRIFNFYQGPSTIGIIPPATRAARIQNLKLASDVASQCGIPAVHTHCGFIPENPNDPLYPQAVAAVKEIGQYCKRRGQIFLCEAGQETPITLLRLIEDTGLDNVFVNLDFANLIMYGKGNPVDAMDVVGHLVRGVHAKDGVFPTNPRDLGKEVPMGQGKVNFPVVLQQLRKIGYKGPLTIEYEGATAQRKSAILQSKAFLTNLLAGAQ